MSCYIVLLSCNYQTQACSYQLLEAYDCSFLPLQNVLPLPQEQQQLGFPSSCQGPHEENTSHTTKRRLLYHGPGSTPGPLCGHRWSSCCSRVVIIYIYDLLGLQNLLYGFPDQCGTLVGFRIWGLDILSSLYPAVGKHKIQGS